MLRGTVAMRGSTAEDMLIGAVSRRPGAWPFSFLETGLPGGMPNIDASSGVPVEAANDNVHKNNENKDKNPVRMRPVYMHPAPNELRIEPPAPFGALRLPMPWTSG